MRFSAAQLPEPPFPAQPESIIMVMFKIQAGVDCSDDLLPPLHFLDEEAAIETLGDFPGAPCEAPLHATCLYSPSL